MKACIFDLDGVLCDTAKYHYLAWKSLADELGIDFTEADNERLKGVSRMQSLEILLGLGDGQYSLAQKQGFAEKKNNMYVQFICELTQADLLPGVKELILGLRERGIKIALGSVSKNAPMIINRLEIAHLFDAVVDGNSVERAKPDPEVFLKGAQLLGLPALECVVFEDAVAGVKAARAAGMFCVGVGRADVLLGAQWVISGFEGISAGQIMAWFE